MIGQNDEAGKYLLSISSEDDWVSFQPSIMSFFYVFVYFCFVSTVNLFEVFSELFLGSVRQ